MAHSQLMHNVVQFSLMMLKLIKYHIDYLIQFFMYTVNRGDLLPMWELCITSFFRFKCSVVHLLAIFLYYESKVKYKNIANRQYGTPGNLRECYKVTQNGKKLPRFTI